MKKIIFGAMAAAALLACSKEQVIEQNRANDEIRFSVVAENQTKAADVYTSANMMDEFFVSATYNNGSETSWYFQNDKLIKNEYDQWDDETGLRYWAEGTHDFYAIVNGTMNMAEATAAPTVNFKPATNVVEQKDLLYAVTTNLNKGRWVNLQFRHALAQIEFKAKNTNPKLYVKISEVTVAQTPGEGTFTYPTESTLENESTKGTWEIDMNTPTDYNVKFTSPIIVVGDSEPVNLTFSETPTKNNNSMLLLPAKTTAIHLDRAPVEEEIPEVRSITEQDMGSYFAVKCQIYNVAGTAYADTDVCLHDGWAIIPAEFDWQQGKKYIYTLVFGGDSGYDGGNGTTPDPGNNDVISEIVYDVTVDTFQTGAEIDEY